MKIIEAIDRLDELKPNTYPLSDKIGWLSTLDGIIKRDIIDKHDGGEGVVFEGYTKDTPLSTELLIGEPYEEMYISFMESKIDYYNAEIIKYNNSVTRYNDAFQAFSNDYNRNHMPKGKKIKYF